MTLIKWILGFAVTLVVLIIAAIIIIPQVVDPNDYRDEISKLVRKQTGRDLAINGDLELSVFPWIGVRTERVTLSQPRHLSEEFGDGNMLEVAETEVKVQALPLLKSLTADKKDIRVATILLKQPKIHIIKTSKGLSSFDGLSGDDGKAAEVVKGKQEPVEESAAKAGVALVVQGVNLEDGTIIWDDRLEKQRYDVTNLQLKTGNLLGKDLVDIKASAEIMDSNTPDQTSFSAKGKARLDIDSLSVAVKALNMSVARGDLEANAEVGLLDFVQDGLITVSQLKSDVDFTDEEVGPAKFNLVVPNLAFDQATTGLKIPSLVGNGSYQTRPISLEGKGVAFNVDSQGLTMENLTVGSEDVAASVTNIVGTSVIDKPKVSGELDVQSFNLRALLQSFDVEYEPELKTALTKFALNTGFSGDFSTDANGNGGKLSLKKLRAQLDESSLQGEFSVANLFGAPSINFDLALDQFNVDNYAPPEEEGGEQKQESESFDTSSMAVPLAVFKEFKANGQFKINSLVAGGAKVENVAVNVVSKGDTTEIKPSAKLYDGGFDGSIKYQETASGGKLTVKQNLSAIQLAPLLKDTDITDQLSGIGNIAVDVVVTESNGVQTNKGTIKLSALNGAIKGVDIKKILDGAQQKYNQLKGRETEEGSSSSSDETRFAEMGGSFDLNNFVLDNLDFALKAPLFRIAGKGRIDLAKQRLDYGVDVSIVKTSEGQGGQSLDKLKGATIPIKFYGPLTEPKYKLDLTALFKERAKEKAKDKLKEKLGISSDKKLSTKDIFKQKLSEKYLKQSEEPPAEGQTQQQSQPAQQQPTSRTANDSKQAEQEKPKTKKEIKEEAKEDLKRQLLDSLFK